MKYHYFISYFWGEANFHMNENDELILDHPIKFKDIRDFEAKAACKHPGYHISVNNIVLLRKINNQ